MKEHFKGHTYYELHSGGQSANVLDTPMNSLKLKFRVQLG